MSTPLCEHIFFPVEIRWNDMNNSTEALHEERRPCPFPQCRSQILLSVQGYHKELYFMKTLRVWFRVLVCTGMKQIPLNLGGRRKKNQESEHFVPQNISVMIPFAILSMNFSLSLSGIWCVWSHTCPVTIHWKLGSEDSYQKLESKYQLLLSSCSNRKVYNKIFIFKGEGKKSCFLYKMLLTYYLPGLVFGIDGKVAMCHSPPVGRGGVTLIHKSPWYIHSAAKKRLRNTEWWQWGEGNIFSSTTGSSMTDSSRLCCCFQLTSLPLLPMTKTCLVLEWATFIFACTVGSPSAVSE